MFLLILLNLWALAYSGLIQSWDIKYEVNNKNSEGTLYFNFQLENSIAADDYLRIEMPFPLNTINDAWWGASVDCNDTLSVQGAVITASTISSDTGAYFVQFYTDSTLTTLSGLLMNVKYFLRFKATPDSSSTTGVVGPVKLYTVSNNAGNWITYDLNPVFGLIYLADDYPKLMTVAITIDDFQTNQNIVNGTYIAQFDVTPTIAIRGNARIDLKMTNTGFSISNCLSIASTTDGITAISSIAFIQINSYTIRAIVSQSINAQKYRFNCSITNPQVEGVGGLQVTNWYGFEETVIESGLISTGLEASESDGTSYSWNETNHRIELGWGYVASNLTALPIFRLYKDTSLTEMWYQSVKTYFQPAADTPTQGSSFSVVVSTISDSAFTVLLNSIYHNLPPYVTGSTATCTTSKGFLTCTGVGSLLAANLYFISFKFNIGSYVATATATDFAKVQLQTSTGVIMIATSVTKLAQPTITTNVPLFGTNGGRIAYTTISGTNTQYIHAGTTGSLNLNFKYFTTSVISNNTATTNYQGIEFYTTYSLPTATSTATINTLSTSDIVLANSEITQNTTGKYTVLRFRIKNLVSTTTSNNLALWTAAANTGTIVFSNVIFDPNALSSTLAVHQNVYDFYARWVQGYNTDTPGALSIVTRTGSSPFFFNSLVFVNNGLFYLNAAMSSFFTGTLVSDPPNTGQQFPTLIRIAGKLAVAEQVANAYILVFFNDLDPIDTANLCFGSSAVTCSYVAGTVGLINTQTSNLANYHGSKMMVIQPADPTASFNIYIPVKTSASKTTIGFFISTATAIDATQNIFLTLYSRRFSASTYTTLTSSSNTSMVDPVSGSTPTIDLTGSPVIGSTGNKNLTVGSAYVVSPNTEGTYPTTAAVYGASYGLCANYNLLTASLAMKQYQEATPTAASKCVSMSYTPSGGTMVYCQVCPVHGSSAMIAANNMTNFIFSNNLGVDFGILVYFSSTPAGNLNKAAYIKQASALTAVTMTTFRIVFSPSIFKKGSINHLTYLYFTTLQVLPPQITVIIAPKSSTPDLYLNPMLGNAGPACSALTQTTTSCAVSGSNTTGISITLVSPTNWPAQEHQLAFYVDSTNPTTPTTRNFGVTIQVQGLTALVNHHITTTVSTFTMSTVNMNYMVFSNFQYTFANKQARTTVQFSFSIAADISIAPMQVIRINLGDVATANANFTPTCHVLDAVTGLQSTNFLTCNTQNLSRLELGVKYQITGTYIVVLPYMIVPSNLAPAGITGAVIAFDGWTIISRINPAQPLPLSTAYTAALLPAANLNIIRNYSNSGSIGDYSFQIRPSRMNITLTSLLYIYFPDYYSPILGYQNLYCTANDERVFCSQSNNLITISSFPSTITVGNLLVMRIYGIMVPDVISVNILPIFLALDNDTDPSLVVEHGTYMDTVPYASLPSAQLISAYSISTNYIRVNSSHTITFSTDSLGIRSGYNIVFDFPDEMGRLLHGGNGPTVTLTQDGSSTSTTIQTTAWGSRFTIPISSDLSANSYFTIVFSSLENIEDADCRMNRISMMISPSSEAYALYRSAPQGWNAQSTAYILDPDLLALNWTDSTGTTLGDLTLTTGVYSSILMIIPPTGDKFSADMTVATTSSIFYTLPSPIAAYGGRFKSLFRLAGSSLAYPNIYSVDFTKTESGSTDVYSNLRRINVIMVSTPKEIVTHGLKIPVGGSSIPYYIDLEDADMIPQEELVIDVSFPTGSLLDTSGASTLTFDSSKTNGTFTFELDDTATLTTLVNFTLTLAGENSASYTLSQSLIVLTVVDTPGTPIVDTSTVTIPTTTYATQQEISVTSDQPVTFYWHVAYVGALVTTDCLTIKGSATGGSVYDANDTIQAQYGAVYVYDENTAFTGVIQNLLSDTTYDFVGCSYNMMSVMSDTVFTSNFTTFDTGAGTYKLQFVFSGPLKKIQIKTLCCLFQQELQLPDANVIAEDGTTCETSTFIENQNSTTLTNFPLYIFGDRSVDETSTLDTDLANIVTYITTNAADTFYTKFRDSLTSASAYSLFQSITLVSDVTFPLPILANLTGLTAKNNDTWIVISGLALTSGPGILYISYNNDSKLSIPTTAQVLAGKNASGSIVSSHNAWYDGTTPVSINFTDLEADTTYMFYVIARNGDLGPYYRTSASQGTEFVTLDSASTSAMRLIAFPIPFVAFILVLLHLIAT